VDQGGDEHGGHRLAGRADHHLRARGDRLTAARLGHPEAAKVGDLVTLDDGDTDAGHAEVVHRAGHELLELSEDLADGTRLRPGKVDLVYAGHVEAGGHDVELGGPALDHLGLTVN